MAPLALLQFPVKLPKFILVALSAVGAAVGGQGVGVGVAVAVAVAVGVAVAVAVGVGLGVPQKGIV